MIAWGTQQPVEVKANKVYRHGDVVRIVENAKARIATAIIVCQETISYLEGAMAYLDLLADDPGSIDPDAPISQVIRERRSP